MATTASRIQAHPRLLEGRRIVLAGLLNSEAPGIEEELRVAGADVERLSLRIWSAHHDDEKPDAVILRVGDDHENSHGAMAKARVRNLVHSTIHEEPTVVLIDETALSDLDEDCEFVLAPFRPSEVVTRIERALHVLQSHAPQMPASSTTSDRISVDQARRLAFVNGRYVDLTYSEFEILAALITADGRVVSRQDLLRAIAGNSASPSTRLTSHVYRLRMKLGEADGKRIKTLHDMGYQLLRTEDEIFS